MVDAMATDVRAQGSGVGQSTALDGADAGREAVRTALAGRTPAAGDLLLVFPSGNYDLDALHAAAIAEAGPASVVGATSCGAVFTDQIETERGCVAAWISAEGASFGVAHVERDDDDIAGSARAAAQTALDRAGERHPHSVLLMISDGLTPDQREVARGAYAVTGATVPLVGGAAGDAFHWKETHTFGDGVIRTRGILAVWLNSSRPMAVSVDHGWRPFGQPMLVTRAEGTIIRELDGRPAMEVYLDTLGIDFDPEDPEFLVRVQNHPLGLPNGHGGYDVRQLHAHLPEGGGLNFNTGLSEQTVVQVMTGDPASLLEGARRAAHAAIAGIDGDAHIAVVFSCGSRLALLGEAIGDEIAAISEGLQGVPACGFFTFGEFGRVLGSSGVHNASVAILAL